MPQPQTGYTPGPEDEEGYSIDLDDDFTDVEEQPDGSAIVRLPDTEGPDKDPDFYSNMAEELDPWELSKLGMKYLELFEKDRQAREDRDKKYEEGLRRTGMGDDAPGGANFQGASKVVHPAMAEGCVDFESRAIKELFPPDGPVRTNLIGDKDEEAEMRAERKRDFMNWQLTEQIEEFRDEEEQMLTQLPLGGSQYLQLWYDEHKKRPCAEFVPIDDVLLPFAAGNFYTAQRVTHQQDITQQTFEDRIASGLYRDVEIIRTVMEPEITRTEKANEKIEGKKFNQNIDGTRRVYHSYVFMSLDEDSFTKGDNAPYILMIDEDTSEVVGLYRNWEKGDEAMAKLDHLIEFKFIPWRGAYAIGLPHLIGGLSAALTGALRALLDTAHINNAATMIKLKGAKVSGQSPQIEVTQVTEIEAAPGIDDIRKVAMPMPFNPPNPVLFELLGWLDQAAKGVVTTSEEKIADVTSNAPVGTTQALIEQGAAVFSAIHARLHESQKRVFKVLQRINRWYLHEMRLGDAVQDLGVEPDDFAKYNDVLPVSDPHIFSETQRMAQTQATMAFMDKYPDLFDRRAVVTRALRQMKVPNISELIPNAPEPKEMNAGEENAAMAMGQQAFAYPHQNHLAHIQSHMDFCLHPMFGSNPMFAGTLLPVELEHIKQHMMLWYLQTTNGYVEKALGKPVANYDSPKLTGEIDKLFALASQHVSQDAQAAFARVLPGVQQLMQLAKQNAPTPPMDPSDQVILQTSMAETQRRAQRDQADIAIESKKVQNQALNDNLAHQIDIALNANDNLTEERIKTAELTHNAIALQNEQEKTAMAAQASAQRTLGEPL